MTTLKGYAQILADLYRNKARLQIDLNHQSADLAGRQLALAPAEGWAGKNEEQRKTARELAYAADEVCQKIGQQITELRDTLADCEAEIQADQELASAARWAIRDRLAAALLARTHGEHTEDAAPAAPEFDQATQDEVDDGVVDFVQFHKTPDLTPTYKMLAPEDELPF